MNEKTGERVLIFDTTLRDGEQSPGASLNINEKLLIAKQLARLNVDIIEAGFPIASEGDFRAVKTIAQKVRGPVICALARADGADIDRAWEAVSLSKKPRIHTFIATSQIHIKDKLRISKEEVIELTRTAVAHAKSYTDDVEFSPEDASRTDVEYMLEVVRAAVEAGANTINIPDTVGYAQPAEFAERVRSVKKIIPNNVVISVHCHNDLGNAVANSLAAILAGAKQIECTVNGLGERAGNASSEEIVMNLRTRPDYFKAHCNVNAKEIYTTSKLVSKLTGLSVQRNKAIVGQNAFAHEAGIHQHGVLTNKATYEIMRPEDVGWIGEGIVIGKHSGRHAVSATLRGMGYELNEDQLGQIMTRIKYLADKKKTIEREDIIALAGDTIHRMSDEKEIICLNDFSVSTGKESAATARVELTMDGKRHIGTADGVGPVDAVATAIKKIVGPELRLKEYNLKAITGGTDALADVTIKLEYFNEVCISSDVNEDVIKASINALLKGINRMLNIRRKNEGK
ncbi:MAG: 2-isopropylmalate synthase [archaeon]